MSSHDSTFDGGVQFGMPGTGGLVAIGEPQSGTAGVEAGAAVGLTLSEAESIAARRLQELAIRLSDDDAESADDEPGLAPFDADRHLRTRLAHRLANLDAGDDADAEDETSPDARVWLLAEAGLGARYVVSEALPLAAFGAGLAALSYGRMALPALPPPPAHETTALAVPAVEPEGDTDAVPEQAAPSDAADDIDLEPEMRLVDLIREQHALLDRLGPFGTDSAALFTTTEAGLATGPAEVARSDAEELFEAGTHAPRSARVHDAVDKVSDPIAISAEQLIAALMERMPKAPDDEAEPEPERQAGIARARAPDGAASSLLRDLVDRDAKAGSLQFMLHEPSPLPQIGNGTELVIRPLSGSAYGECAPFTAQALANDAAPERAPIIIERARAEMTAIANGTAPPVLETSPAIGFFAGLSLSLVCGVGLYVVL